MVTATVLPALRVRAPGWIDAEQAARWDEEVRRAFAVRSRRAAIAAWIADAAVWELAADVQRAVIPAAVVERASEIIAWHRMRLPEGEGRQAAAMSHAESLQQTLKKAAGPGRRAKEARPPAQASISSALPRTAVGRAPVVCKDSPSPETRHPRAAPIPVWSPPAAPGAPPLHLPPRERRYVPGTRAQQRQWETVKGWRLGRLEVGGVPLRPFAIGAVAKAVRAWWKGPKRGKTPPVEVLRRAFAKEESQAACASPSGSMWTVEGPLDARQLAAYFGTPAVAGHVKLQLAAGMYSEAEMRAMFGGATYSDAVNMVLRRADWRMDGRLFNTAQPTLGAAGAGIGLTWMQAATALPEAASLLWMAEAEERTQAAGADMARRMGHLPCVFGRAEAAELADCRWRTTVELVTTRCAYASSARPARMRGVEAALNELVVVIRGSHARGARVLIYETTAGLWRKPALRQRVEGILQAEAPGDWEAVRVSPHLHLGARVRRDRVFYVRVRRE